MSHQPANISAGTQVVSLVEVRGTNDSLVHPRGAVGVVTRTPTGDQTLFLVRFPDGFEKALERSQLEVLKHFKDRLGAPVSDPARAAGAPSIARAEHAGSETGAPGSGVITKHHSHHYFGFAETQWKLFLKESPRRVKPLLYVYRVLLTGIHLMRTGTVEANLVALNEEFRLPFILDLIARKLAGPEQSTLPDADLAFHEAEYQRLRGILQAAHDASPLPEAPSAEARTALNNLLVRVRMGHRNP